MFSCTSTHTSCYAAGCSLALRHTMLLDVLCSLALPHICHAVLLDVLLHFHTCYAAGCSLALPHMRHAMLLDVLLHFHTYVMLRCCAFSCTYTHASKAMFWTTSANFVLETKKRTFRRNPRQAKLEFRIRACKTLNFPLLRSPFQGICARNLFQKTKHVQITTVSDISIIVLGLCDVITDTASYRPCCFPGRFLFSNLWGV